MDESQAVHGDDYFEAQHSKDCVLHSLNNAFGKCVVTKDEVLAYIEKKIVKVLDDLRAKGAAPSELHSREVEMRSRYSSGRTFFSADIVWETAKEKGLYYATYTIPGLATPHVDMSRVTPEVTKRPIVILGGDFRGATHAIASRNGYIYDSERFREGPVELTKPQLIKSLPKVFGAYAFVESREALLKIRHSASSGAMYISE